jgi:hypothetical protein
MRKSMHGMECSFTLPWPSSAITVGHFYRPGRESDRIRTPDACVSEAHTCVQIVRFCARWLQSAFIIHRFQAITQRMVFVRSQPGPRSR